MSPFSPAVAPLEGGIQHYAWGDPSFIPRLLGVPADGRPFAEYWMGAHPDLPSRVADHGLDQLLAENPEGWLGSAVAGRHDGTLPYLMKVLSAGVPLSIQAHPSLEQAREGFTREDAAGIPREAGHRNYKDPNHKPELIAAVTEFWGLRGFRPLDQITEVLNGVPELRDLAVDFDGSESGLRSFYARAMTAEPSAVDTWLDPWVRRLETEHAAQPFPKEDPSYWVLQADREFSRGGHRDRGLLSVLLLNLVRLEPGQAMYLPAGVLHAYLSGTGLELMANSNNVLRGGLTPKHVDVPELLRTVRFEGETPEIVTADTVEDQGDARWSAYRTPAPEFELDRLEFDGAATLRLPPAGSLEIGLVLEAAGGPVEIRSAGSTAPLPRSVGEAFVAPVGAALELTTSGPATIFRARVPA